MAARKSRKKKGSVYGASNRLAMAESKKVTAALRASMKSAKAGRCAKADDAIGDAYRALESIPRENFRRAKDDKRVTKAVYAVARICKF